MFNYGGSKEELYFDSSLHNFSIALKINFSEHPQRSCFYSSVSLLSHVCFFFLSARIWALLCLHHVNRVRLGRGVSPDRTQSP